MRHAIESFQTGKVVSRRVVYKPAIFAAYEEVVGQVDVRSATVDECGARLGARCCEVLRIEEQSTGATENERRPPLHRHPENVSGGDFMRVVIHAELVVLFGIVCPRVVRLDTVVTTEPEAIRSENASTVGRVPLN